VELHGGRVKAESSGEGQGAVFTVWLPLYSAGPLTPGVKKEQPVEEGAAPDPEPRLDGVRILVVEDDADNREMLIEALRRSGAVATPAASVQEALTVAQHSRLDVIVSDITMPGEDGYALIRRLRALSPETRELPVIALTAHARSEDAARIVEAGFTIHLAKPVRPTALCAAIARVLGQHRP
jgi:CheY-like chemotaxis protein